MRLIPSACYTVINNAWSADGEIAMTEHNQYQIRVQGWISERWVRWFDGMAIAFEGEKSTSPITTLTGTMADQAALRGTLTKIWDLNLVLVSVIQISGERGSGTK
jgi:hypothetical protein